VGEQLTGHKSYDCGRRDRQATWFPDFQVQFSSSRWWWCDFGVRFSICLDFLRAVFPLLSRPFRPFPFRALSGFMFDCQRLWISPPRIFQKKTKKTRKSGVTTRANRAFDFEKACLFYCFLPFSRHLIYFCPAFFHFCIVAPVC